MYSVSWKHPGTNLGGCFYWGVHVSPRCDRFLFYIFFRVHSNISGYHVAPEGCVICPTGQLPRFNFWNDPVVSPFSDVSFSCQIEQLTFQERFVQVDPQWPKPLTVISFLKVRLLTMTNILGMVFDVFRWLGFSEVPAISSLYQR